MPFWIKISVDLNSTRRYCEDIAPRWGAIRSVPLATNIARHCGVIRRDPPSTNITPRWRAIRRDPSSTNITPRWGVRILLAILLIGISLKTAEPSNASTSSYQPLAAQAQETATPRALIYGQTAEGELSNGEAHSYKLTLASGQYLRVVIEQQSVDVSATMYGPDARQVAESNNPHGTRQPEILSLVTDTAGDYLIDVRPVSASGKGHYTARIVDLRDAKPDDSKRVKAYNLFAEGERLSVRAQEQSQRSALADFRQALPLLQEINDRLMEAMTLVNIGSVEQNLSHYRDAIGDFELALPILRELGHRRGEAQTLNNIGWAYSFLGDAQKALDYYQQALPVRRDAGDRRGEAQTETNIGSAYESLGEPQKALEHLNTGLKLARAAGDGSLEGYTLDNIGALYRSINEPTKALEQFSAAMPVWRESGNQYGVAYELNLLGMTHRDLGDFERALENFNQSLVLSERAGNRYLAAQALNNIGAVFHDKGDYEQALDYYNRSLTLRRAVADRIGEATTLGNIGLTTLLMGNPQAAIDYLNRAVSSFNTAHNPRGEAVALENIGSAYVNLSDFENALKSFARSLALSRAAGLRQVEANALGGLARANRLRGNLAEARSNIEVALDVIETVRGSVSTENFRTSYFATKQEFYEFYISLLIEMHQQSGSGSSKIAADALEASEKARARSLLDSLVETRADIRQGADPELLASERDLRLRIEGKNSYRLRLLNTAHTAEQIASVDDQIAGLQAQYRDLKARIRERVPQYAALTQPETVSLETIQKQLLDDDTILLEYALGSHESWLWAVTPSSFDVFTLPERRRIEQVARQAYELLTVSHRRQHKREAERAAGELSRLILQPVADRLGKKRLVIVADRVLQYIPFGALPVPPAASSVETYRPLVVDHEIVYLPSASVLAALRKDATGRRPVGKHVAVFADPVLKEDDERIKKPANDDPSASDSPMDDTGRFVIDELHGAARAVGLTAFERLPFTGREAEAILSLADHTSLSATGFNANLENISGSKLSDYQIVHFATHGLINSDRIEMSGLVLSLMDERGHRREGFLRARDIYNLKLGAGLVVLSSCRTALGKQVRGEGLVGLVRGFMYAGTPRVVASVWDVKDRATAELMKNFYTRMLVQGMRPAAALRAAQVDLLKDRQFDAPYYWAGFVIQGEWK